MIIFRYLTKEILTTLLGVTLVLLLIFLSHELVRFLGLIVAGKFAVNILMQLMGFQIPYLLALLLPLGLYLGIILAYGRLYADSELRVLHACGVSLGKLITITSALIIVTASTVIVLSFWVNPWIAAKKDMLIAKNLSTDNILDTLTPGRFRLSPDGKRVLYVERISRSHKRADNIFIADQTKPHDDNPSSWSIVSAAIGSKSVDPVTHDSLIIASNGYRYEGIPGQNDFKMLQFKKYSVVTPQLIVNTKRQSEEALSTQVLWKNYQNPDHAAEFQWRFSLPLSVLVLGLLAIPLSQVRPRFGRYSQLLPALLIYVIYVNLLFITRNWVEQKFLPIHVGMWWVHLLILSLVMIFIYFKGRRTT